MKPKEEEIDVKFQRFLKENSLAVSYTIDFPLYKVLPDEVKLALSVLSKNGMKIMFVLKKK